VCVYPKRQGDLEDEHGVLVRESQTHNESAGAGDASIEGAHVPHCQVQQDAHLHKKFVFESF
jgi:hypothetical protein